MTLAISLDFETLSLEPNAVLLALGAVAIDTATGESVADFYAAIDPATQPGRHISASTVYWWLAQNDAARAKLTSAKPLEVMLDAAGPDATDEQLSEVYAAAAHPLAHVAQAFLAFYNSLPGQPEVWSNGAVDHAWLQSVFDHAGLKNPVPYWKQRDYRTLKNLLPHVEAVKRADFVAHDAMHDARYQAEHLVKLLAALPIDGRGFTDARIEPHILAAGECPPQSKVVLASSLKRLRDKYAPAVPAPTVDADLPDLLATHVEGAAAEQSAAEVMHG